MVMVMMMMMARLLSMPMTIADANDDDKVYYVSLIDILRQRIIHRRTIAT